MHIFLYTLAINSTHTDNTRHALHLFVCFRKCFEKLNSEAACEKQGSACLPQHSVSSNTNMVADESQHQFCTVELQEHREVLWSKQKNSPSVEWQPSVLVFSSVFFLKVICFRRPKHSPSVYYSKSKSTCPSLGLCRLVYRSPSWEWAFTEMCWAFMDFLVLCSTCWSCCMLSSLSLRMHLPQSKNALSFSRLSQAARGIAWRKKNKSQNNWSSKYINQ